MEVSNILQNHCVTNTTYRNQDAVQVGGLALTPFGPAQDLGQAPHVADAQDGDVVLAAEGLDEGEVNLQGHVLLLVVGRQQAQNHVVWVTAKGRGGAGGESRRQALSGVTRRDAE